MPRPGSASLQAISCSPGIAAASKTLAAAVAFGYDAAMPKTELNPKILTTSSRVLGHLEVAFLVVIAIATLIASVQEMFAMAERGRVALADLLLLFIYLEVLSMVAVYLDSGALPVRIPLYIAMVALARHIILDMKEMTEWGIASSAGAVLILAAAVLVVRIGHVRFPYATLTRSGSQAQGNE